MRAAGGKNVRESAPKPLKDLNSEPMCGYLKEARRQGRVNRERQCDKVVNAVASGGGLAYAARRIP